MAGRAVFPKKRLSGDTKPQPPTQQFPDARSAAVAADMHYDQRYLEQVRRNRAAAERFGPHVKAVAKTIFLELSLCSHALEVLKRIDAEYPDLRFSDFVDAARLIDIFERQRGNA
jgi:hypothetical protein